MNEKGSKREELIELKSRLNKAMAQRIIDMPSPYTRTFYKTNSKGLRINILTYIKDVLYYSPLSMIESLTAQRSRWQTVLKQAENQRCGRKKKDKRINILGIEILSTECALIYAHLCRRYDLGLQRKQIEGQGIETLNKWL